MNEDPDSLPSPSRRKALKQLATGGAAIVTGYAASRAAVDGAKHYQDTSRDYLAAQAVIAERVAKHISIQFGIPEATVDQIAKAYEERYVEETRNAMTHGEIRGIDQKNAPVDSTLGTGAFLAGALSTLGFQSLLAGRKELSSTRDPLKGR